MLTLVSACMNRDQHLRQSLPHWLTIAGLTEVVIVDWSNRAPLIELCALDPRVRIIRIENEPRWILSYAYNIGLSRVRTPYVFKCDADCLPHLALAEFTPSERHFYSGYWKSGASLGKPCVNGQCIFRKADFDRVNGYSEYIRTYGRDDEDFYERLSACGIERREIPPSNLEFIEHTQEERTSNQFDRAPNEGIEAILQRDPIYNEMYNLDIATRLPWGPVCQRAPFEVLEKGERWERLRRDKTRELAVSADSAQAASLFALRRLVRSMIGLPEKSLQMLNRQACLDLIANRLKRATQAQ